MKQNRIVILLPLSVMIGLFLFGYYILNQSANITNEELVNHILMEVEIEQEIEARAFAQATWMWGDFPSDGIIGDDIIEIILLDDAMEAIPLTDINGSLLLEQSGEVIYEDSKFVRTEEGIAFTFPNEIEDTHLFGPRGSVTLSFEDFDGEGAYVEVKYYHTWEEWESELELGRSIHEQLESRGIYDYWHVSRSTSFR